MKKILSLLSILFLLAVTATFTSSVSYADVQPGTITNVTGVVLDGSNHPLSGAIVTVTCSNGAHHATTSKLNGSYQVLFSIADNCIVGDTVSVVGTNGSATGGGTGQVHLQKNLGVVNLDFSVVNFSVPEFSPLFGMFAGLTALGSFYILKKRNIA